MYNKNMKISHVCSDPAIAENVIITLCEILSDNNIKVVGIYPEIKTVVADDGKVIIKYRW